MKQFYLEFKEREGREDWGPKYQIWNPLYQPQRYWDCFRKLKKILEHIETSAQAYESSWIYRIQTREVSR